MPSNRIDAVLTVEQREQAKAALASLTATLPFLIDLGADEKAAMPKFGEKNRSFEVRNCVTGRNWGQTTVFGCFRS